MTSSSSSAAGGMTEGSEEVNEEGGRGAVGSATAVGTESEVAETSSADEGSTWDGLPVKFEFGFNFGFKFGDLALLRVFIVAVGAEAVGTEAAVGESVLAIVAFFFEAVFFLGGIAN